MRAIENDLHRKSLDNGFLGRNGLLNEQIALLQCLQRASGPCGEMHADGIVRRTHSCTARLPC